MMDNLRTSRNLETAIPLNGLTKFNFIKIMLSMAVFAIAMGCLEVYIIKTFWEINPYFNQLLFY
jgi:hypothetical protein